MADWLYHKKNVVSFFLDDSIQNPLSLSDLARWISTGEVGLDLPWLLSLLKQRKTTDSRDHVYGLLGLCQRFRLGQSLPKLILPNYQKSLVEVWRDATRFGIEECQSLSYLALVALKPFNAMPDISLPSWVPQWHMDEHPENDTAEMRDIFSADDNIRLERKLVSVAEDPDSLSLLGFATDTVSGATSVATFKDLNTYDGTMQRLKEVQALSDEYLGPVEG